MRLTNHIFREGHQVVLHAPVVVPAVALQVVLAHAQVHVKLKVSTLQDVVMVVKITAMADVKERVAVAQNK